MSPYFDDGTVQLYLGDCREVLREIDVSHVGVTIADPPYGETSLTWDRWPPGWVDAIHDNTPDRSTLWCFGSMRMFLDRRDDFARWKLAQDVIWRKTTGSGFVADRFKRIHEHAIQWYRGSWGDVYKQVPRVPRTGPPKGTVEKTIERANHLGAIGIVPWVDDGTRLMASVIDVQNTRGHAIHPTQKPLGIIDPLLRYSLAPGGTVLDPFAGSCSTLAAAREAGYRAIGIEADEAMCAKAAERLAQGVLFGASP